MELDRNRKNLLAVRRTNKKDTSANVDGVVFEVKKQDDATALALEDYGKQVKEVNKKYGTPLWITIIRYVLLFYFLIVLTVSLSIVLDSEKGIEVIKNNLVPNIILDSTAIAAFAAWLILTIIFRDRRKSFVGSEDEKDISQNLEDTLQRVKDNLEIPADAYEVDYLTYAYTNKNGKDKKIIYSCNTYFNISLWTFIKDDNLMLADAMMVLSIPLSSIKSITKQKKKIMFGGWNKVMPEDSLKEFLKENTIVVDAYRIYSPYSIISIEDEIHGNFELFIPNYESSVISKITGIPIYNLD